MNKNDKNLKIIGYSTLAIGLIVFFVGKMVENLKFLNWVGIAFMVVSVVFITMDNYKNKDNRK